MSNIVTHTVFGISVGHKTDTDYINATSLAKAHEATTGQRRDVSEWLSNKRTQETLQHVSSKTGIPVNQLHQSFRGSPENGGGTWLHKRVAVRFAMWLSDEFGYIVEEWFENGAIAQPYGLEAGVYTERIKMMIEDVRQLPPDYWCVLHESMQTLLYVETVLKMPVRKADLLDGSIGKRWSAYREGKEWAGDRIKVEYTFPDGQRCNPWAYQMQELGHFRHFMKTVYQEQHLPKYLESKYGVLVKV